MIAFVDGLLLCRASGMSERHWNLNRLQKPSSVHLCLTGANAGCHDDFVRDSAAVSAALLSALSLCRV